MAELVPANIPCPIDVDAEADEALGSPTELAEDSDMEGADVSKLKKEEVDGAVPKMEKRKRRQEQGQRHQVVPAEPDEESPSKRAHAVPVDDRPVSGGELRQLLQLHARELKEAWQSVENRLDRVEHAQDNQRGEMASMAGRIKVVEKDVQLVKGTRNFFSLVWMHSLRMSRT